MNKTIEEVVQDMGVVVRAGMDKTRPLEDMPNFEAALKSKVRDSLIAELSEEEFKYLAEAGYRKESDTALSIFNKLVEKLDAEIKAAESDTLTSLAESTWYPAGLKAAKRLLINLAEEYDVHFIG